MPKDAELQRKLGLADAVVIGLGAMIGAGIFAALSPAAAAAGSGLLVGLAVAAVIAYCNATSSARLAARYPASGGPSVYGRERLGVVGGYLAGWGFVVGKTASCAAMALTIGAYVWPGQARAVAVAAVVAVIAVDYRGIQKSAALTRVIVAVVVGILGAVVVAAVGSGAVGSGAGGSEAGVPSAVSVHGVLQAAGLLFFAFAGYARIATLGAEVRDPRRTIPRAIPIALGLTLLIYAVVACTALAVLGPDRMATSAAPLTDVAEAGGGPAMVTVVAIGGAVAALGSLVSVLLGVSRTTMAMARDGHLPRSLGMVHPRFAVPHRAEIAVGVIVVGLVVSVDIRGAIGFSSFGVLVYYLIANVCAATLTAAQGRPARWIPLLGAVGCVVLMFSLPAASAMTGAAVLACGALVYLVRVRVARRPR